MRLCGHVLVAIAVLFAPTAFAWPADCDTSMQPGFIVAQDTVLTYFYGVTPEPPNSAAPIHIETARIAFIPSSVSVEVHGHEIALFVAGEEEALARLGGQLVQCPIDSRDQQQEAGDQEGQRLEKPLHVAGTMPENRSRG